MIEASRRYHGTGSRSPRPGLVARLLRGLLARPAPITAPGLSEAPAFKAARRSRSEL